jgi:hypothetical protein
MPSERNSPVSTMLKKLGLLRLAAREREDNRGSFKRLTAREHREWRRLLRVDGVYEIDLHDMSGVRTSDLGNNSEISKRDWRIDDAIDAFERIVADVVDKGESEVAVDILLELIGREADTLHMTTQQELEETMRTNARIEQLLHKVADHQVGTDAWLSRLR